MSSAKLPFDVRSCSISNNYRSTPDSARNANDPHLSSKTYPSSMINHMSTENGWKLNLANASTSKVLNPDIKPPCPIDSFISLTDVNSLDPGNGQVWATAPDNDASDVDAAVQAAHTAFQSYRKVNPRTRARWLLKWDSLIRDNKEDLAKIVTYETGKPIAESLGELDYALGFTWWFAGEAERITGTIQVCLLMQFLIF